MTDALRALFARARENDEAAWREIVNCYQRLVHATIRHHGVEGDDAEEVFQETFVRLHKHIGRIEDPARTAKWLMVVARRLCIDLGTQEQRLRAVPTAVIEPEPEESPDDALIRLERQQVVREALHELPPRCRHLLSLLYYELPEPDYGEVAHRLGMPVGSVGPTRARCFEKLLARLRRRGFFLRSDGR